MSHTASSTPPKEGAAGRCCCRRPPADGRSLQHAWPRHHWSTNNQGLLYADAGQLDAEAGAVCMLTLSSCRRPPHSWTACQRRGPEAAATQRLGPEPDQRLGLWVAVPVCLVDWRCDPAGGGTPFALRPDSPAGVCYHSWSSAECGACGLGGHPAAAEDHTPRGRFAVFRPTN